MKLVHKYLEKDNGGSLTLIPEEEVTVPFGPLFRLLQGHDGLTVTVHICSISHEPGLLSSGFSVKSELYIIFPAYFEIV